MDFVDGSLLAGEITALPGAWKSGWSCSTPWQPFSTWQWGTTALMKRWDSNRPVRWDRRGRFIGLGLTPYREVWCTVAMLVVALTVRSSPVCVQVLSGLSDVGSSHAEIVLGVLRARQEEIRHALLARTTSISSAILQNFDWQLKVTSCFIAQCLLVFNHYF